MAMDVVEAFIQFDEPRQSLSDELKKICKQLLTVCQTSEIRSVLLMSTDRLLPPDDTFVTVTVLNKLIFVWDSLPAPRTTALTQRALALIVRVLHGYMSNGDYSTDTHSYSAEEIITRCQRALRVYSDYEPVGNLVPLILKLYAREFLYQEWTTSVLLISISQQDQCLCYDELEHSLTEIVSVLKKLLFPHFTHTAENVEVSALAGTALCNVLRLEKRNWVDEYQELCPPDMELRFGHIAVTAGVLNSLKGICEEERIQLAPALMSNILQMCHNDLNKYHSFSCLLRFLKSSLFTNLMTADQNSTVEQLVDLLWVHLDSPVKGVSEYVTSCLQALLLSSSKHCSTSVPLHQQLIGRIVTSSWHNKTNLKLLSVLIPWIDASQLLESSPHPITKLAQCMSAQYLMSAAAKVYSVILQQLTLHTWTQLAMREFMTSLTSDVKLIRHGVREYWLPATLAKLPAAGKVLISELSTHRRFTQALIAVYRACRTKSISVEIPANWLESSLLSISDELRADVISIICGSQSTGGVLNEYYMRLLERYLAYNLNIDCPTFRRRLKASLNTHVGSIALVLKTTKDLTVDHAVVGHLCWLWRCLQRMLVRGSNYQRKETVIELYISLVKMMSNLSEQDVMSSSKRSLLAVLRHVICRRGPACSNSLCSCDLTQLKQAVLRICVLDSSTQIQDLGYRLLTLHIPESFIAIWGQDNGHLLDSLSYWTQYITSAKASEAESGAKLYTLIVTKAMRDVQKFVKEDIVSRIEYYLAQAETDHTSIVTAPHIHGYLIALRHILTSTDYLSGLSSQQISELGSQMVHLCHRAAGLVLQILSSTCADKEVSPSFEQMEDAISQLVVQACSRDSADLQVDMTEMNERVTAWCWLTLKESCSLVGSVSICSIQHKDLLSLSSAESIRYTFYSTLTRCRHRGVIEGSCAGLVQFCQAMRKSGGRGYSGIPTSVINQVMDVAVRGSGSTTSCSVTRRSGGFPLIIQSVLSSEPANKQAINLVVDELLHLSADVTHVQQDDTTDMPQVHALNILKALVVDTKLTGALRPYLAAITVRCIDNFSSPVWALRNAATQLFASCSQRIIGQKSQSDGSVISTGSVEFFSQFPVLYDYMLDKLRTSNPYRLSPQIFPILSLISKLSSCTQSSQANNSIMNEYRTEFYRYMVNPIYKVRRLVSLCIIATIDSVSEMISICIDLFYSTVLYRSANTASAPTTSAPTTSAPNTSAPNTSAPNTSAPNTSAPNTSAPNTSANAVHTALLTIYEMMKVLLKSSKESGLSHSLEAKLLELKCGLWGTSVDFLSTTKCDVLSTCYVDILLVICKDSSDGVPYDTKPFLSWLASTLSGSRTRMPGEALLLSRCSELYRIICGLDSWFTLISTSKDIEIRSLVFDSDASKYCSKSRSVQLQVWLCEELTKLAPLNSDTYLLRYRNQLLDLLVLNCLLVGVQVQTCLLRSILESTECDSLTVLPLLVLSRDPVLHSECPVLSELHKHSQPAANEETRHVVCDSIGEIGKHWERHQLTDLNIIQAMDILLTLLQDESVEIRLRSSITVTSLLSTAITLHQPQCTGPSCIHHLYMTHPSVSTPIQFNIAIELVLGLLPLLLGINVTRWSQWLLHHIQHNIKHFTHLNTIADRSSKMFHQEEINVYLERSILVNTICTLLTKASDHGVDISPMIFDLSTDGGSVSNAEVVQVGGMQQSYNEVISCYEHLCEYVRKVQ